MLASYAFLHVFLAHAADGKLGDDEVRMLSTRIWRAGQPLGLDQDEADRLTQSALDLYWETLADHGPGAVTQIYRECVEATRQLPDEALERLREDLIMTAEADGHLDDMEAVLIAQITPWHERHAQQGA